ncbi:MAG TPA: glycosyltransferase family 9 protein, partial [Thermoanaerobaculia bacterium]|nr:glycosyltransferase family 9 protein [Thermoanaerobaculia bacterium]
WRAAKTRREISDFLGRLRGRGQAFDLVVDAQGLFKSAIVTAAASSAGRRVGFGWRTATERVNCLFTDEHVDVDRAARPHVVDQMLALAEHVTGTSGFERTPDVRHLIEKEDPAVDSWLQQHGSRPFAVLQPFSSKVNKEWGAGDVVAFAERLGKEGIQPVLRWGPGEESRADALITLSKKSSSSLPSFSSSSSPLLPSSSSSGSLSLVLAPATTPASTARLAARAALFVGADTGPTHLAAAAGTPTLVLFGPTPAERFGPVGARTAVLGEFVTDYNRSASRWPADAVHEAVRSLLA